MKLKLKLKKSNDIVACGAFAGSGLSLGWSSGPCQLLIGWCKKHLFTRTGPYFVVSLSRLQDKRLKFFVSASLFKRNFGDSEV